MMTFVVKVDYLQEEKLREFQMMMSLNYDCHIDKDTIVQKIVEMVINDNSFLSDENVSLKTIILNSLVLSDEKESVTNKSGV